LHIKFSALNVDFGSLRPDPLGSMNLHIKFSALNVDFGSLRPDPLSSMKPAHAGVKERYIF